MKGQRPRAAAVSAWVARALGFIILAMFLTLVIGETVTSLQEGSRFDVESLYIILPLAVATFAYLLSWWHQTSGGVLFIFIAIVMGVLPPVVAWQHHDPSWSALRTLLSWLVLGLPFLATGIMFLASSYLAGKAR